MKLIIIIIISVCLKQQQHNKRSETGQKRIVMKCLWLIVWKVRIKLLLFSGIIKQVVMILKSGLKRFSIIMQSLKTRQDNTGSIKDPGILNKDKNLKM